MKDSTKTCLSLVLFTVSGVLSLIALGIGWYHWDFTTGALAAFGAFAVCFLLAGMILLTIKNPNWFTASLPALFGFLYILLPGPILGPFDDMLASGTGSLLSYFLWFKRKPDMPKWVILPLLVLSIYPIIGGFIPGPVDELIVGALAFGASAFGISQKPE